jgi:hypothetical protein
MLGALVVCPMPGVLAEEAGDFGRAPYAHVDARYAATRGLGETSGRASLLLTDEEQEMLDRFWRFLRMPDGHQWDDGGPDRPTEGRAAPSGKWAGPADRYFRWLKATQFASSHTRFNALTDAIEADLGTLGATFRSICVTLDIDDRRSIALAGLDVSRQTAHGALLRRHENYTAITWFVAALRYRQASYAYALDHLLVESPHEEARRSDAALSDLDVWVAAAGGGDFCAGDPLILAVGETHAIPGRVLINDDEIVEQK